LIGSLLNGAIDVHVFGTSRNEQSNFKHLRKEYLHLDGVLWHALVPEEVSIQLEMENVVPNEEHFKCIDEESFVREMNISSVHGSTKEKVSCLIPIRFFPMNYSLTFLYRIISLVR
jgi:hypothetical protein